jgi:serine/threonine protein kinase
MQIFKKVYAEFVKGEASVDTLLQAILDLLDRSPEQSNNILIALSRLQQSGKLPLEDFSRLLTVVSAHNKDALSPVSEDKTVFTRRSDDATVVAPPTAISRPVDPANNPPAGSEETTVFNANTSPTTSGFSSPTTGRSQHTWTGISYGTGTGTPEVGAVIKDRFLLESVIGSGGMGLVFKARDLRKEEAQDRNPWVAIKLLNDDFKSHPEALRALQREARKSQDLSHPNIITVFDFDRDGNNVYMTMELMEGDPLDKVIRRIPENPMPVDLALRITHDMGLALAYAHRAGIVHSDFKPSNVFLVKNNAVKVFDFGIARASQQGLAGAQGEVTKFDAGTLGALTPAYASLEMIRGEEPDTRDDIYALACVAYELLTGKHPFGKKSADVACAEKLVPAMVAGLDRKQMRGLLKGLAFERANRSASVEQFLDDIRKKTLSKAVIGGGVAAAAVLVVAGAVGVPFYIEKHKIESMVEIIKQGDEAKIIVVLDEIQKLEKETRKKVITDTDAQDGIIHFIEIRVAKFFDPDKKLYDYPAARDLLKRGTDFYKDSATLKELVENTEKAKNALMLSLDTLYTQYLESGKLLEDGSAESIPAVLAIVRQVDPASSLLKDKRLADAYLSAAKEKFSQNNYLEAEKITAAGLDRFANDPALVNIRDSIKAEQTKLVQAEKISKLATDIDAETGKLAALQDTKNLEALVKELRTLDSEHPSLKRLEAAVGLLADAEFGKAERANDWSAYDATLVHYKNLAGAVWVAQKRDYMARAQQLQQQQRQGMIDAVVAAVNAGKLEGAGADTAETAMKKIIASGADQHTVEHAYSALTQAYIKLAREDRHNAEWDKARKHVQTGLAMIVGNAAGESLLKKELSEIDLGEKQASATMAEADRAKMEQERKQKVQLLQHDFDAILQGATIDTAAANSAVDKLDELASLDPSNALVSDGGKKLAERVATYARTLSSQGKWEDSFKLVQDVSLMVPGSQALADASQYLTQGMKSAAEQAAKQEFVSARDELDTLLKKSEFTPAWESSVKESLKAFDAIALAQNQTVAAVEMHQRIAKVYVAQIGTARDAARFTEAEGLLSRAKILMPDGQEWAAEATHLADAQKQFEQVRQDQAKVAKVDGLKQTILTQAKANDVRSARKSLDELTKLAPDDTFIKTEAPQAIVDAYSRLAENAAKSKQYESAVKYAQSAMELMPSSINMKADLQRYSTEMKKSDVAKAFKSPTAESMQAATRLMSELKTGLSAADASKAPSSIRSSIAN